MRGPPSGPRTAGGPSCSPRQMRILLETLLDQVERFEPAGPATWARNNKHIVALTVPVAFTPAG